MSLENYEVVVHEYNDVHECNVRHRAGGPVHQVVIPKQPDMHGSRFGICSCGIDKTKTIPCVHMIAATKSSEIPGLSTVNIMPSWCYTSVWREQFGEGTVMRGGLDIQYLKNNYQPNPKLRYCPNIAAAAKAGRKKNMKRFKSPLEKKAKKRKATPKIKLTATEEMELGEDMKMGTTEEMELGEDMKMGSGS